MYSLIAIIVKGKDIIELGSSNIAGLSCLARYASTVTTIQSNRKQCAIYKIWEKVFSFFARCEDVLEGINLDADYVIWWQKNQKITNIETLKKLKEDQCAGRIRNTLEAVLLFDE